MPSDLPSLWTFAFYALVVWGMSAVLVAFRLLAHRERTAVILRVLAFTWLGVPAFLASAGVLSDFDARPPQLMRVVLPMAALIVAFALSPWGGRVARELPFSLLIGTQLFRLPLEFVLFALSRYGLLPREMTFAGFNFDVVTGAGAGIFWLLLRRERYLIGEPQVPTWSLWTWNVLGLGTLTVVVGLAVLSFPQPFGWFSPENEIVAYYPWVWLPTFLVQLALVSHLLIFRKLLLPAIDEPNV
ncbi:MAG TPA: hypothetical protein VLC09_13290 [Polyangiaceae bacterium]|nr:hypothetical protein [Polyangiaceae bacterium]